VQLDITMVEFSAQYEGHSYYCIYIQ
jgi:hypothetical protein